VTSGAFAVAINQPVTVSVRVATETNDPAVLLIAENIDPNPAVVAGTCDISWVNGAAICVDGAGGVCGPVKSLGGGFFEVSCTYTTTKAMNVDGRIWLQTPGPRCILASLPQIEQSNRPGRICPDFVGADAICAEDFPVSMSAANLPLRDFHTRFSYTPNTTMLSVAAHLLGTTRWEANFGGFIIWRHATGEIQMYGRPNTVGGSVEGSISAVQTWVPGMRYDFCLSVREGVARLWRNGEFILSDSSVVVWNAHTDGLHIGAFAGPTLSRPAVGSISNLSWGHGPCPPYVP
jgi:hypothetical protein